MGDSQEASRGAKGTANETLLGQEKLDALVEALSSGLRRDRQNAAKVLSLVAKEHPENLIPYKNDLIDALNRPEAQTRWECLDALTRLVEVDSGACREAIPEAETALFDEESGLTRLAAMRFLCRLGAADGDLSETVWPLIDEGIQCYHGDSEFQDMLVAVTDFSLGSLSPRVKEELAARMKFDATNGKGALKRRAVQILENLSE